MRKLLLSLMLAMTLAIGSAATALASTTYKDTVVGVETAVPTGSTSTFAGYASGQLPGLWTASVVHGSLPTSQSGPGAITSGTFALFSSTVVSGIFDNSQTAITLTSGTCTQTFHVVDNLRLLSPTGTGHFDAYLTHYGYMFNGNCTIFFATIHGSVRLKF
jgi:hypothetical protein